MSTVGWMASLRPPERLMVFAQCMSLVFGGEIGKTESYTLYAGSLDDPSAFHPTISIFAAGRPAWALIPPGFKVFGRMPP